MKILKIILIVIFSFILAVSGGLLVFGAMQPRKKVVVDESAAYSAPADNLYIGEFASSKIDISAIKEDNSLSSMSERAAKMIVNASYNNIYINKFFYRAFAEVEPTKSASDYACSEYYRAKTGANMYYLALAYTGSINPVTVRIDYVDQRVHTPTGISTPMAEYDRKTKEWSYNPQPDKDAVDKEVSLPTATPYNVYSWYDFPLDLGGKDTADDDNKEVRSSEIDYSLIDEKSVKIEEKVDDAGNEFYTISFKADIEKMQKSRESLYRFSDSFGSLEKIDFSEFRFEVDIWKNEGVFRRIYFYTRTTASIGSSRGEVIIYKNIAFSYEDHDASVAWQIRKLADTFSKKWVTKFKKENQEKIAEEIAALPPLEKEGETSAEE